MGRRAVDRPFRVNLQFNGPDKVSESRVFGEVFRAVFGTPINRRTKQGRVMYRAALAISELIDIDAAEQKKALARVNREHARRTGKPAR